MMDRERHSASDSEGRIPEAWIGQEVMIETTEALSSDLRAAAPCTWRTSTTGASSYWGGAPTTKASPPATSTLGASWVGYVWPRRTCERNSKLLTFRNAPSRANTLAFKESAEANTLTP